MVTVGDLIADGEAAEGVFSYDIHSLRLHVKCPLVLVGDLTGELAERGDACLHIEGVGDVGDNSLSVASF